MAGFGTLERKVDSLTHRSAACFLRRSAQAHRRCFALPCLPSRHRATRAVQGPHRTAGGRRRTTPAGKQALQPGPRTPCQPRCRLLLQQHGKGGSDQAPLRQQAGGGGVNTAWQPAAVGAPLPLALLSWPSPCHRCRSGGPPAPLSAWPMGRTTQRQAGQAPLACRLCCAAGAPRLCRRQILRTMLRPCLLQVCACCGGGAAQADGAVSRAAHRCWLSSA